MKRNLRIIIICLCVAAAWTLGLSPSASQLWPGMSTDATMFYAIGHAIVEGMVPYRDIFDHKGPFLFLVNAAGYLLGPGKWGLYVLATLFLGANLVLTYKIARLYASRWGGALSCLVLLYWMLTSEANGNTCEEWSLPFAFLPLYLVLRHLRRGLSIAQFKHSHSLVLGLCIGVELMVRATNAASLAGIALALVVLAVRQKAWRALWTSALYVLGGVAIAVLPFVAYYCAIGAWDDFFFANYTAGVQYSRTIPHGPSAWVLFAERVAPIAFALVALYWRGRRSADMLVLVLSSLVTMVSLCLGQGFGHYYILLAPCLVLVVALMTRLRGKVGVACWIVATLLMCWVTAPALLTAHRRTCFSTTAWSDMPEAELLEQVPAEDRPNLLVIGWSALPYNSLGVVPRWKYFSMQGRHSIFVDEIVPYLQGICSSGQVPYVLVRLRDFAQEHGLLEHYTMVGSTPNYDLWRYDPQE